MNLNCLAVCWTWLCLIVLLPFWENCYHPVMNGLNLNHRFFYAFLVYSFNFGVTHFVCLELRLIQYVTAWLFSLATWRQVLYKMFYHSISLYISTYISIIEIQLQDFFFPIPGMQGFTYNFNPTMFSWAFREYIPLPSFWFSSGSWQSKSRKHILSLFFSKKVQLLFWLNRLLHTNLVLNLLFIYISSYASVYHIETM